jgi:chromosome segregation ATPase
LDHAEEEISRLKTALEAQEKEVARLQRNLKRRDEQLEDIREELDEVIHLPTPRITPASEHENSMRKYTACQYVARTLRALRVDAETEEEREALLLKAERHLGRLANVEMDGIWDLKADADALFMGLVNGSSARAARHAQRGVTNPSPTKVSASASTISQQRPSKRRRQGDSDQL